MSSGFTTERAAPHDRVLPVVIRELQRRGYRAVGLPVDGHRPDIDLGDAYLEVKTYGNQPNVAIEINDVMTWHRIEAVEQRRVYILSIPDSPPTVDPNRWRINTPESLKLYKGPLRPTVNGSNDDFYLYRNNTGTPFPEWFTDRPTP